MPFKTFDTDGLDVTKPTKVRPKGLEERPVGALGLPTWTRFQASIPINLTYDEESKRTLATCVGCRTLCEPFDDVTHFPPSESSAQVGSRGTDTSYGLIRVGALVVTPFTDNTDPLHPEHKWRWVPATRRGYGCESCRERYYAAIRSTGADKTPFLDVTDEVQDWAAEHPWTDVPIDPEGFDDGDRTCDVCGKAATGNVSAATGADNAQRVHSWCKDHEASVKDAIAAALTRLSGTLNRSIQRQHQMLRRTKPLHVGKLRCSRCNSEQRVWFNGVCWQCTYGKD